MSAVAWVRRMAVAVGGEDEVGVVHEPVDGRGPVGTGGEIIARPSTGTIPSTDARRDSPESPCSWGFSPASGSDNPVDWTQYGD